jgi:hypothetical protein
MKNAKRRRRTGGKCYKKAARENKEVKAWAAYVDPDVRKAAVQISCMFSLPVEHFEATKLRLELKKLLEGDSWWPPPRPARRLSSRSPSRDREEACVILKKESNVNLIWENREGQ